MLSFDGMVEFSYPAAFLKPGFDIKIIARSVEYKWAFQRPRGSRQGLARSPDRATGKFFLDDPSGKANRRKRLRSPHSGLANQERTQKPEHPQRRSERETGQSRLFVNLRFDTWSGGARDRRDYSVGVDCAGPAGPYSRFAGVPKRKPMAAEYKPRPVTISTRPRFRNMTD